MSYLLAPDLIVGSEFQAAAPGSMRSAMRSTLLLGLLVRPVTLAWKEDAPVTQAGQGSSHDCVSEPSAIMGMLSLAS